MNTFRRFLPFLLLLSLLTVPAAAQAAPSTYQRFDAKLVGGNKAGSAKKPAAVGLALRPYHQVGLAGGKDNTGGLNSGAVMESPAFATAFANIWLPKELKFNTGSFPGCNFITVLNDPDLCPKGSEVGLKNSDDACGSAGKPLCSVYAKGLVRGIAPSNNLGSVAGLYALETTLSIRIFVISTYENGSKAKDAIALRVLSPLTGNIIIPGQLSKATGSAAKTYGNRMRFSIPRGLISPLPGLISQLTDFNAGMQKLSIKGQPLIGLTGCPKSKKLTFGYNGEYVINAKTTSVGGGSFVVGETGPVVKSLVACK